MRKKGFFFIIDSIVAVSVLIVGVLLIYASQTQESATIQAAYLAQDTLGHLSSSTVRDVAEEYVLNLRLANTSITDNDLHRSMLEMIYLLRVRNQTNVSEEVARAMLETTSFGNYNLIFYLNGTHVYNRTPKMVTQDQAITLITSRSIVVALDNFTLHGPVIAEVRVW